MKKLNELINTDYDVDIYGIKINSKNVQPGDLFICTDKGTLDRHNFIDDAINRGASAIIVKKDIEKKSVPIIKVDNPNDILPVVCSRFYDEPEKKLRMIGVTGTDGKTSTSTIISILIGQDKCGYIGTNGYTCHAFNRSIDNTTPDADLLYGYLNDFCTEGCTSCAMEVSSEALMRGRVKNIKYDITLLTNITSEHLNSHGSLENYVNDKCKLFSMTKDDGFVILNKDDTYYERAKESASAKVLTYGKNSDNDLYFSNVELLPNKTNFDITYQNVTYHVKSNMVGMFNVYNLCAAILALCALGYKYEEFEKNIKNIKVSGRLENVELGQNYHVIVDYAHTPNGITKLMEYVKILPVNRIITVIGQAGERDAYKRKEVGKIVADNSDIAIFTYEDPRNEDPNDIINDMTELIKEYTNYEIVIDRSMAIKRAIDLAKENDLVLILGKGNETYEKVKDQVIYFNDIEEAQKYIKLKGLN